MALLRSHTHALIALEEMTIEARHEADDILERARRHAVTVFDDAQTKARSILAEAQRDAEQLRATATLAAQHPVAAARADEATTQVALAVAELHAQIGRERAGIDAVTERLAARVAMVAATLAELISPSLVASAPEPMRAAPQSVSAGDRSDVIRSGHDIPMNPAAIVRWSVATAGLGATPLAELGISAAPMAVVAPTPSRESAVSADIPIGLPLPRRRTVGPTPFDMMPHSPSSTSGCATDADDAQLDAKFTEFFEHDGHEPSRAWILGE
jgi:hypothetical protein